MIARRDIVRRSLSLRQVDCGSCNACESELAMVFGPDYDGERGGFAMAASPRHADGVLITGPGTMQMRQALERTHAAVTEPTFVVALGDCAVSGDPPCATGYAVDHGSVTRLQADLEIPGCPPTPADILAAICGFMQGNLPGQVKPHATGRPGQAPV